MAPTPVLVLLSLAAYLAAAGRERTRRSWSAGHAAAYTLGAVLLAIALSPGFDAWAEEDFGGHMAQHLVLAMVAPLGLVLGAPVTLLLRTLPHRFARRLGRLLRTRLLHALTHPLVALVLSSGGVVVLYFTPLYQLSTRSELVHVLVHAHLILSGALFAWVVAGPDPSPHRASVRLRLVVLGAAVALHASVAQLIFAGLFVHVNAPVAELQAAGSLMYFGGDIAELLLAVALLVTWRPRRAQPSRSPRSVQTCA